MQPQRIFNDTPAPSYDIPIKNDYVAYFNQIGALWHWQIIAPVWKADTPPEVRINAPETICIADGIAGNHILAEYLADVALRAFTQGDVALPYSPYSDLPIGGGPHA